MTEASALQTTPPATAPQPWGYFATLAWVVLAYVIASIAAAAVLYLLKPDRFASLADVNEVLQSAWGFSVSTLAMTPLLIGMLAGIAWLARWTARDYFALHWPARRAGVIALVALAVFLPLQDAFAYLVGKPIVTPFQIDLYLSAQTSGSLLWMWLAVVIAAPLVEEIVFRGFIYRGWVKPQYNALPAIVVISALFAILHLQYDWFGIFQVFCIGLVLTVFRWHSGSTLLTFVLHAITNLYSTLETVAKVAWLP